MAGAASLALDVLIDKILYRNTISLGLSPREESFRGPRLDLFLRPYQELLEPAEIEGSGIPRPFPEPSFDKLGLPQLRETDLDVVVSAFLAKSLESSKVLVGVFLDNRVNDKLSHADLHQSLP